MPAFTAATPPIAVPAGATACQAIPSGAGVFVLVAELGRPMRPPPMTTLF
ncbi:hypothetical protein [Amycolatopsis sp. w19]